MTQQAKGIERNFKRTRHLKSELELFDGSAVKILEAMNDLSLAGMVTQ